MPNLQEIAKELDGTLEQLKKDNRMEVKFTKALTRILEIVEDVLPDGGDGRWIEPEQEEAKISPPN